MVLSMTGFATKTLALTIDGQKVNVSMSLKSLNSRYFEVHAKMPYPLSNLETDLAKLMKSKLFRGKVYFTIYLNNPNAFKGEIDPSLNTIKEYVHALDKVKTTCNIAGELTISDIMKLPNIFNMEEREIDEDSKAKIMDGVSALIDSVTVMRTNEGAALEKDIVARVERMSSEIKEIAKSAETLIETQKVKLQEALKEIGDDEEARAELHKRSIYTALDKMDINEEIVRFNSHLDSIKSHLSSDKMEKGKRLDFTLQELAREINTIAAKCSDANIGSRAINIKVELEKAREQAQNIV